MSEAAAPPSDVHYICPSCDHEPPRSHRDPTCPNCGARMVEVRPRAKDLSGQVIDGRFEIRDLLGEGGMGSVYRAWQRSIGREVAIKLIDERHGRDPMAVRRFLREARLASQLSQPNTISVFDFGQAADGRLFIAMELIRGRTLAEVLEADGPFPTPRAAWVGVQLCDALDAAHRLKIVHRDLKPANIVLLDDPPGRDLIKVLDFGLAKSLTESETKATDTGLVVGTPRYMAPEVVMGEAPTPQSDLYAVGVILGELSTGKVLWDATSFPALAGQKMHGSAVIHEVPAGLRPVVSRLIDPEPARRPQSAGEVRGLLRPLVMDSETPIPFTGPARAITDRPAGKARSPSAQTEPTVPVLEIATPPPRAVDRPRSDVSDDASTITARTPSRPMAATGALDGDSDGLPPVDSAGETARVPPRDTVAAVPDSLGLSAVQPAGSRRGPVLALGAAVVFAIVGIVMIISLGGGDKKPRPPAVVTAAAAPAPPIDAPSAPPPVDAPPAGQPVDAAPIPTVKLTITSKPPGATVLVDGQSHGPAPVEVDVPRGTRPIVVEVLSGGRTARQTVVPDRDRALTLTVRRSTTGDGLPF